MAAPNTKMGQKVNKFLHVDPAKEAAQHDKLAIRARQHIADPFFEEEPTVAEFMKDLAPTRAGFLHYIHELFPCARWLPRYNLTWLTGDVIAGITIGFVVVPQAMAYAILAQLSPEYGLYTSFTGAIVYFIFGTSRDIVIGTTAVGSLLVGEVVSTVLEERGTKYTNEEAAKALSFMAGMALLVFGLLRVGWIIEFIPYVPISAFVTAASITIMSTQIPTALGISGINTREAPYKVFIETFKGLPRTKVDAAIGLSSIALLFFMKWFFGRLEVTQPQRKKLWSTINSLRLTFTMVLYTFIAFLVHMKLPRGTFKFRLVGEIPRGFQHAGVPKLDPDLVSIIVPKLPAVVIILIIEHIAIAKSFGKQFGYTVITSQEMCSQGAANLFSPFVGGYTCTGSFGASAVLSKSGVRTPLAGLFSAFILILALYVLTGVFYFIPNAALAGLIIHAVCNLPTPPSTLYKYWRLAPLELVIWVIGVIIAIFSNLETSIYATVGLSFALVLIRLAHAPGRFMGKTRVQNINDGNPEYQDEVNFEDAGKGRDVYLPLDRNDPTNPRVELDEPYPGVFIYKFTEAFCYINQAQHMDTIMQYIKANTRRTKIEDDVNPRDRLWCDAPATAEENERSIRKPVLRAVIFDCSAINNLDITSINGLVDLRTVLSRHAAPYSVDFHFAPLLNRWTRRALHVAGFGFPHPDHEDFQNWMPMFMVAANAPRPLMTEDDEKRASYGSISTIGQIKEANKSGKEVEVTEDATFAPVSGVDRPFFHVDMTDAVNVAVHNATRKHNASTGMSF